MCSLDPSDYLQPLNCDRYPIAIIGVCYSVCDCLYCRWRITHGNAEHDEAQHGYVIHPLALTGWATVHGLAQLLLDGVVGAEILPQGILI